jgi:hypothetical protein
LLGHSAELPHEAHHVGDAPTLGNPAALDRRDVERLELDAWLVAAQSRRSKAAGSRRTISTFSCDVARSIARAARWALLGSNQ